MGKWGNFDPTADLVTPLVALGCLVSPPCSTLPLPPCPCNHPWSSQLCFCQPSTKTQLCTVRNSNSFSHSSSERPLSSALHRLMLLPQCNAQQGSIQLCSHTAVRGAALQATGVVFLTSTACAKFMGFKPVFYFSSL